MSELLKADAVSVWRGELLLLNNISFTLNAGQVLRVHGANGSGKTTLLRVVCGLGYADEGEVSWRGQPMQQARSQFNQELLYLGHKAGIKGSLTPVENLSLFAALGTHASQSGKSTERPNTIEQVLDELALQATHHIPCRHLSAGQQRRVALARLVLQSATLWVLDEPLTSLDAHGLDWVTAQIDSHVRGGGAVLLTTHADLQLSSVEVATLALS